MRKIRGVLIIALALIISLEMFSIVGAEENKETKESLQVIKPKEETQNMVPKPRATEFIVTFNIDFVGANDSYTQNVIAGELAIKPKDPQIKNTHFLGWYDEDGKEFDFMKPIVQDITLFAKFRILSGPLPKQRFEIIFIINGDNHINSQLVETGKSIGSVNEPKKRGYGFLGWYTKRGEKWDLNNSIWQDMTLYAHWEKLSQSGTVVKDYSPKTGNDNYLGITALLFFFSLIIAVRSIRLKRNE